MIPLAFELKNMIFRCYRRCRNTIDTTCDLYRWRVFHLICDSSRPLLKHQYRTRTTSIKKEKGQTKSKEHRSRALATFSLPVPSDTSLCALASARILLHSCGSSLNAFNKKFLSGEIKSLGFSAFPSNRKPKDWKY